MRGLVVILVIANVALFVWVRHENLSSVAQTEIPPPDIGTLHLRNDDDESVGDPPLSTPASSTAADEDLGPGVAMQPPASEHTPTPTPPSATAPMPTPMDAVAEDPAAGAKPGVNHERSQPHLAPTSSMDPSETDETVLAAAAACAEVGPLAPNDADRLVSNLPEGVRVVSQTTRQDRVPTAYYVLVPPLADRDAGIEKLRELRDAGFADSWLFRGGEYRNAISLGLFSNRSGAEKHADNVRNKGFDADVRDKLSPVERRWLVLRLEGGDVMRAELPLPEGAKRSSQPCP